MSAPPELRLDAEACERVAALLALRPRVWERVPAAAAKEFDEVVYSVDRVLRLWRSPINESEVEQCLKLIDVLCQGVLGKVGESAVGDELTKAVAALTSPARDYVFESVRAGAPPQLRLDAEACERVAALLALRPRVWERVPAAAAKEFDDVVLCVEIVLGLSRSPKEYEVDREGNLARFLEHIDAGVRHCRSALREKGESEAGDGLATAVATMTAPVRDHLARVWAGARLLAGRNAIINLLPQEYLIRCARCRNTAERLRVLSDSVSLTNSTQMLRAVSLPLERAQALFATLERKGAAALCKQVERESRENVIGYCPKCRALYCHDHYVTQTTWSGTWFDTVYGTCPEGHRRELA